MEKWKTKKRFPTFPCDARDDNHGFSLSNPTPKKGSRSLRGLLTLPTFRIILYWNQTRFQDHSWIGKCSGPQAALPRIELSATRSYDDTAFWFHRTVQARLPVQPPDAEKPHVRWCCGRVPGRNPRHSTRSQKPDPTLAKNVACFGLAHQALGVVRHQEAVAHQARRRRTHLGDIGLVGAVTFFE